MKISFGEFKGRNIVSPKNNKMRPTTGIAKSVIFNSIDIEDKTVLDLFSGTGALGLESLSQGAKHVVFSDVNYESIKAIKQTLNDFNVSEDRYKVFKSDFRLILKKARDIDVIMLDPPFSVDKYYDETFKVIEKSNTLSNDGIIVLEKKKSLSFEIPSIYEIIKEKKLGEKDILILKRVK